MYIKIEALNKKCEMKKEEEEEEVEVYMYIYQV